MNPGVGGRRALTKEFRRRHPRADPFEFFDGHAIESVLAAGLLDGPDDHPLTNAGTFLNHDVGKPRLRTGRIDPSAQAIEVTVRGDDDAVPVEHGR